MLEHRYMNNSTIKNIKSERENTKIQVLINWSHFCTTYILVGRYSKTVRNTVIIETDEEIMYNTCKIVLKKENKCYIYNN